jgi:hypothetical protein
MTCSGAYASSWAYAAFWCVGSILTGADDSGGAGNPSLQDTQADFLNLGVRANEGMRIYNTTVGTDGPITAVTATTVTATGVTWDDGDAYRVVPININEIATIEHYLNVTANNIHAARAASGGCDCTLASWAEDYLAKINIIEAGAFHQCPCAMPGQRLTAEDRRLYLEWSNQQLDNIRVQKTELCDGATGSEFPAVDWAEQSVTEFAAAQIIANRNARRS